MPILVSIGLMLIIILGSGMLSGFLQLEIPYNRFLMQIVMLGIVILCVKKFRIKLNEKKEKIEFRPLAITVFAGVGIAFFNLTAAWIAILSGMDRDVIPVSFSPSLAFSMATITAGIAEELFYRGVVFNLCKRKYGFVKALIISSVLFSLSHAHPVMLFHTFVSGILFAYFYEKTGKIYIPMILHMLANFMNTTMITAYIAEVLGNYIGSMAGIAICIAAGVVIMGVSMKLIVTSD